MPRIKNIQKTRFVVTVLHAADERPNAPSLETLEREMDSGGWVGEVEQLETLDVPSNKVVEYLEAVGNDGTFFDYN